MHTMLTIVPSSKLYLKKNIDSIVVLIVKARRGLEVIVRTNIALLRSVRKQPDGAKNVISRHPSACHV